MRALLSKAPGGPETLVLDEVLDPTPQPGQVVIEVKAVGINFPDTLIIEDRYQFKPERPFSPGGEVAGVVDAVGEGVKGLHRGDRASPCPAGAGWWSASPFPPRPSSRCPTPCRSRKARPWS